MANHRTELIRADPIRRDQVARDQVARVPDHQAAVAYLARLKSAAGRSGMQWALRKVTRVMGAADLLDVDWSTLTAANVEALIAQIGDTPTAAGGRLAPASVATVLNALKGVAKTAWKRETLATDTWERIRDVKAPGGSRLPTGRDIGAGERAALIQTTAADATAWGARDTALLAMLIATGMRRAEAAALALSDIDLEAGRVRIVGKGDKERTAFIRDGAMRAVRDWLLVRGMTPGALFCAIGPGGIVHPARRLSATGVHLVVKRRAGAAGVTDITAHDFRRTFVGELLDAGQDITVVSALVGHSDPKTTARYDRRGERALQAAAAFISVPYYGRT